MVAFEGFGEPHFWGGNSAKQVELAVFKLS